MRAAVIHSYGTAERVLELAEEVSRPRPDTDELLVRIKATSVNPIDCRARSGYGHRFFEIKRGFDFPLILGSDLSGIVQEVGSKVRDFRPGDLVFAAPDAKGQGSYAEYRVLKAHQCAKKPFNLSHIEAAGIPYVAQSTWVALVDKARFNETTARGKRVLVHGGSGGIGSFAIQLLKAWGAYVITTCSPNKVAWVKQLNPDEVINYRTENFAETISTVDLVLDTVGGDNEALSLKVLAKKQGEHPLPCYVSLITPVLGNIDKMGVFKGSICSIKTLIQMKQRCKKMGIRYEWALFRPNHRALHLVSMLIEQGKIRPVVDRVFPLTQIVDAHRYVESGNVCGKVVIEI